VRARAEEALRAAHEKLSGWVSELEQRHRELALLNDMGDLLHACVTVENAYAVIRQFAPQLFPAEEGLLGILNAPGNLIHPTVTWGESATSLIEHSFLADDCWALRRGRLHSVEATRPGLLCAHLPLPVPSAYVCVPDHFKAVNDTFGHEAGDVLLRQLGKLLQTHIRAGDIACRYGGEEFTLIVPDTSLEMAVQRAEQLREHARQLSVEYQGRSLGPVTISFGIATFPLHDSNEEAVLRAADAALYRAKAEGRDRVIVAQ
jgi:diguanylate cyclase (GGDEF)-like protein